VKNLCTFLCQDVEKTPTFAYTRSTTSGILSFQAVSKPAVQRNGKDSPKDKNEADLSDEAAKARLSRRGAGLGFDRLSMKFGPRLLEAIPAMWQSMVGGLLSACATGTSHSS
jgi:TATA-binding protein-associated factor